MRRTFERGDHGAHAIRARAAPALRDEARQQLTIRAAAERAVQHDVHLGIARPRCSPPRSGECRSAGSSPSGKAPCESCTAAQAPLLRSVCDRQVLDHLRESARPSGCRRSNPCDGPLARARSDRQPRPGRGKRAADAQARPWLAAARAAGGGRGAQDVGLIGWRVALQASPPQPLTSIQQSIRHDAMREHSHRGISTPLRRRLIEELRGIFAQAARARGTRARPRGPRAGSARTPASCRA